MSEPMMLYCSGCKRDKFSGFFSAAMRNKTQDCQRFCMACMRGKNAVLRKRHRGQRSNAWNGSDRIILPGSVF